MDKRLKNLLKMVPAALLASIVLVSSGFFSGGENESSIPVQHRGRVKPLAAFSHYALKLITEKERWDDRPPVEVIVEALRNRALIPQKRWIRLDNAELIERLGLSTENRYFSHEEIAPSKPLLEGWVRSSQEKRDLDLRPTRLEQSAESLYAKILAVEGLHSGDLIRAIPQKPGEAWLSPYIETDHPWSVDFMKMIGEQDPSEKARLMRGWTQQVLENAPQASARLLKLELIYYQFKPFDWAWGFYLLAFLFLSVLTKVPRAKSLGLFFFLPALFLHTAGLAARILVLQRPPVSNMFESMIYMNWVLVLGAGVFSLILRNTTALSIGSFVSAMVMIYAALLPIDQNLDVLVPVLRSNYWLTIHVMTIVASYGLFGLAMGLGHRHLFLQGRWGDQEKDRSGDLIYRVIQLGVLLLGIGTVLGGVWANESWGRFWGWDPKETWALITFLGYLLVVHLRHFKFIGPLGLALGSVLGFLLVLMTWYGVNFVLGRGLHSYGFGSGGMIWIAYFLAFEALFLGWAFWGHPSKRY